jgi:hypothetical protein
VSIIACKLFLNLKLSFKTLFESMQKIDLTLDGNSSSAKKSVANAKVILGNGTLSSMARIEVISQVYFIFRTYEISHLSKRPGFFC